jgi:hypothetical protein
LQAILQLRTAFTTDLAHLRTGRAWLLEAEALLSAAGGEPQAAEPQTAEAQALAFATWRDGVARRAVRLTPPSRQCRAHWVGVLTRMQPHLFAWMVQTRLPRTNNDLERFIRAMKTRYRRMSGRKNWQAYLLRYGQRIAFFETNSLVGEAAAFERHLRRIAYTQWPQARLHHRPLAHRLRTQFRFTHRRADILRALEERWAQALDGT